MYSNFVIRSREAGRDLTAATILLAWHRESEWMCQCPKKTKPYKRRAVLNSVRRSPLP
jgi:hypothetical protein